MFAVVVAAEEEDEEEMEGDGQGRCDGGDEVFGGTGEAFVDQRRRVESREEVKKYVGGSDAGIGVIVAVVAVGEENVVVVGGA